MLFKEDTFKTSAKQIKGVIRVYFLGSLTWVLARN